MDVVISARVPEDTFQMLKKHKANISEIVRASLIEAAEKEKLADAKKSLGNISNILKKINKKEFIAALRADRNESH